MEKNKRNTIFWGLLTIQLVWFTILISTNIFSHLIEIGKNVGEYFYVIIGILIALPLFLAGLFMLFSKEGKK